MDKWIVELLTSATVIVSATVALIVSILKGRKQIVENIPMKIKKQTSIDVEIQQLMEELKERLKADRIQVHDFHNGGHYANGRSALKTSCTFEVVRVGVKPTQMALQTIPISVIASFINALLISNKVEAVFLEDIKEKMPATYQLRDSMDVGSFYDVSLCDKYDEPIGFLSVQFTDTNRKLSEKEQFEVRKVKWFIEQKLSDMNIKGK